MNLRRHFAAHILVLAILLPQTQRVQAENWPGWRGPRGDGTSNESNVPTEWDGASGKNIAWKIEISGTGHSAPIVWEDRVFVTTCLQDTGERLLLCYDRDSGQERWRRTVVSAPLETKHRLNSYASSTPVTDGTLVYVSFLKVDGSTVPAPNVGASRPVTPGQILVACYDMQGNFVWSREVGRFVSAHGFCSSPILYDDLVIINGDHDGDSYIVALEKDSGKTVWDIERIHKTRSYVTPIIRRVAGQDQLVMSGSKRVVSLQPSTGKLIWTIEGPTEQFVASMVFDGQRFYMCAGFPTYHVMGIRGDGKGDVTDTHVDWHVTNVRCYVPSPVVIGPYLIVADDRGTANCFDTETGKRHWQARLSTHFSSSLVTAGGLTYLISDTGETTLLRPGKVVDVVGKNELGEQVFASPAISNGRLFIRAEKHLYCIQSSDSNADGQ
jgi:outer membrane protein assembly factor BamB